MALLIGVTIIFKLPNLWWVIFTKLLNKRKFY